MKERFHPVLSIMGFLSLLIRLKIRTESGIQGRKINVDDKKYLIFRHVEVIEKKRTAYSVVLILRFRFPHTSLKKDKWDSFFQIPVFAGLPGFCGKLWTFDEKNGTFQGIYEWEDEKHARKYLSSFAGKFVRKKALPGSVSSRIIHNMTIQKFLFGKIDADPDHLY